MKSKTLALITLSLITVAALVLTAGLSLLHGSATEDIVIPDGVQMPESSVTGSAVSDSASEPENATDGEQSDVISDVIADISPDVSTDVENNTTSEIEPNVYPEYAYTECDVNTAYIDGSDRGYGVVIDIYSHKTGELVGQLSFVSEEICNYIGELKTEEFDPANELWIDRDKACVPLPKGDYRIEVYAGTWFAYTYGNGDMFELTQCTLTFAGGEKLNGYIDFLISDLIADIEAGNVPAPDPQNAVSKLLYGGLEGYWNGYYCEAIDRYIPAAGRFCERFPYIKEN